MIHEETHIVDQKAIRPAGRNDECFYCQKKLGEEHKEDCVLRERTVVMKYSFYIVIPIPENWSKHNIEFHHNEGSWCFDSAIEELKRIKKCLCGVGYAEYIREATVDDEELWDLRKINYSSLFESDE